MKISDEMLSGFLDAELTPEEMEQVRQALETDDDLVMRMADISQVDQWVVEHAQQIDNTAVPNKLVQLAQQIDALKNNDETHTSDNVVQLSTWKKWASAVEFPYSLAAGFALVVAVGLLSWSQQSPEAMVASDIAAVLDQSLSGDTTYATEDKAVTAQLSFANQQGQLCRQYQVTSSEARSSHIACKQNNGWQLAARSLEQEWQYADDYQAASSDKPLDAVIDKMISGVPLDRNQEQQAIQLNWQSTNQR